MLVRFFHMHATFILKEDIVAWENCISSKNENLVRGPPFLKNEKNGHKMAKKGQLLLLFFCKSSVSMASIIKSMPGSHK